jgi:hypothetical protein
MAMPTILFSAWTIPEFDMVGGAIVLTAAATLKEGHKRTAALFMALAILTKETTAIIMWAWLLARAVTAWRVGNKAPTRTALLYLVALLAVVWPILTVSPPVTHAFAVSDSEFEWSRALFLGFHNLNQVFYVLGPSGALLLLVLATARLRPMAVLPVLFTGILALLVLSPIARHYNHYESIIFADWPWVLGWMSAAALSLLVLMVRGTDDEKTLAFALGAVFTGLLLGPILASFSRADLSARLYAPVIPVFHALALRGAKSAVKCSAEQDIPRWLTPSLSCIAVIGLIWHAAAGAISSVQFAHARFPVELEAKQELIATLHADAAKGDSCPWVYYTNRDQELAIEELALLGDVSEQQQKCTRLIQLSGTSTSAQSFFQQSTRLHGYDHQRVEEHSDAIERSLLTRQPMPVSMHLYVQIARSQMGPNVSEYFDSDFEWATDRLPETDVGYFEQAVGMTLVNDTPLERLFSTVAHDISTFNDAYIQLPLWFFEIPQRLMLGIPVVERWEYSTTRYSLPKGALPKESK